MASVAERAARWSRGLPGLHWRGRSEAKAPRARASGREPETAECVSRRDVLSSCLCPACASSVLAPGKAEASGGLSDRLVAFAMRNLMHRYERQISDRKTALFSEALAGASSVLEVGIGTGPNLKYYRECGLLPGAKVVGLEPNAFMDTSAEQAAQDAGISEFAVVRGEAERMPFQPESFDAILATLVLCSVSDLRGSLDEISRVLKPGGVLAFVEHVAAPEGSLLHAQQKLLDPLQQWAAGGCHLTRRTGEAVANTRGLEVQAIESFRVSGMWVISPHVAGIARKMAPARL